MEYLEVGCFSMVFLHLLLTSPPLPIQTRQPGLSLKVAMESSATVGKRQVETQQKKGATFQVPAVDFLIPNSFSYRGSCFKYRGEGSQIEIFLSQGAKMNLRIRFFEQQLK